MAAGTPQPLESLKAANTLVGQLITVCVGLLTFTVTFAKEFKPANAAVLHVPGSLKLSWILLLLAAFCGFWALGAIAGTMKELERGNDTNPKRTNINVPVGLMFACFLAALISLIVAGWKVAG
jgi:hypothetical protein